VAEARDRGLLDTSVVIDLARIAANELPFYTRNADDLRGLGKLVKIVAC
jgi:hypothetical protein